jgi:hypothetical protein
MTFGYAAATHIARHAAVEGAGDEPATQGGTS